MYDYRRIIPRLCYYEYNIEYDALFGACFLYCRIITIILFKLMRASNVRRAFFRNRVNGIARLKR